MTLMFYDFCCISVIVTACRRLVVCELLTLVAVKCFFFRLIVYMVGLLNMIT